MQQVQQAGRTLTPAEIAARGRSGGTAASSAAAGSPAARSSFAYDPLKAARQASTRTAAGAGSVDFSVGDQVSHGKFGFGLVVDVDEKTVTVIFESVGQKKLAKGIAPIKKV